MYPGTNLEHKNYGQRR